MTINRVLIAYGSKHGGTAEIAEIIGETLRAEGITAEVLPAGAVERVDDFDAVVVGGALYANRWHRDARAFARRFAGSLRGRPVFLFSSGPLDRSAEEQEIPPVPSVAKAMQRLQARGHVTFGGRLAPDAKGFLARAMVRNGHAGDFRNPDRIRTWAKGLAV